MFYNETYRDNICLAIILLFQLQNLISYIFKDTLVFAFDPFFNSSWHLQ